MDVLIPAGVVLAVLDLLFLWNMAWLWLEPYRHQPLRSKEELRHRLERRARMSPRILLFGILSTLYLIPCHLLYLMIALSRLGPEGP